MPFELGIVNYLRDTFPVLLASSIALCFIGGIPALIIYRPAFTSRREYRQNLEKRIDKKLEDMKE